MKKIPVLDTIRYAYGFTFGHLGTIIGLIWLPMVLLAVPDYFVQSYYYNGLPAAIASGDTAAASQYYLLMIGWYLVSQLPLSIMYVAVTRQALGLREGPAVIHFALGANEFRVFGGMMGFLAILYFFLWMDGLLLRVLKSLAAHVPAIAAVGPFAFFVLLIAIFYAVLRVGLLFIPATVAEGTIGLARSWELTRGNFWRALAVLVCVLAPLFIVGALAVFAILGREVLSQLMVTPGADQAKQIQAMTAQMRITATHLPVLSGLYFVMAPFSMGLGLSSVAYAYRSLAAPAQSENHTQS